MVLRNAAQMTIASVAASHASKGMPAIWTVASALKVGASMLIHELCWPSATSASPRTAIMLPKVTMTGLILRPSMSAALTAPTPAPIPNATAMATPPGA